MRYYSAKGALIIIVIGFISLMTVVSLAYKGFVASIFLFIVIAYFLWMWFDTYYLIIGDKFFYKCALLKGTIDIAAIHEIIKNKTQHSGIKVALANKGLTIKYNRWDDIYISPKDAEAFIDALKKINPNIRVTG